MEWGKITIKEFEAFIHAINFYIKNKKTFIKVKDIRRFYKIKNSNKSKINYYFRFLNLLEHQGLIKLVKTTPIKIYKLPVSKIDTNQIIKIK